MSEYQRYQFDTVDRCLTASQRKAVAGLSSHISVSASSALVEYHYSGFKHDPIEVLGRYFDLYTYTSNWGTQRVAFRFDRGAVDRDALAAYALGQAVGISEDENSVIIDCYLDENWDTDPDCEYDEDCLSCCPFADFYQEIIEGDYRSLFLFRLRAAELGQAESGDFSGPLPDGLGELGAAHLSLIRFVGLSADLLAAAQLRSKPMKKGGSSVGFDPEKTLQLLSREEALYHLESLLLRNPSGARSELMAVLRDKANAGRSPAGMGKRESVAFSKLAAVASETRATRSRLAEEERRSRELSYFDKLRKSKGLLWAKAVEFIERKKSKDYEYATLTLLALKRLANRDDEFESYYALADALFFRYPKLTGLRWRLERAEVVSAPERPDVRFKYRLDRWRAANPPDKEYPFELLEA